MKFTWTQMLVLGNMATKYLGRGWGNYEDVDVIFLYHEMVRQGASVIEMGAMAEQFVEFYAIYKLKGC